MRRVLLAHGVLGSCVFVSVAAAQTIVKPVWRAESNQIGAGFGSAVASAGDVNGDGYSDLLVGAYALDGSFRDGGGAAVFHGSPQGPSKVPDWSAEGARDSANFGETAAGAGDVNGDGYDDVLVGSPQAGRVDLWLGSSTGLEDGAFWSVNPALYTFGWDVAGAGDVNGDGFDDLVYSFLQYTNDQALEGRVFVHLGSPSGPSLTPDWIVEGDQANARFGSDVAGAGDVNGDGFDDLLVGAPYWDNGERNEGRVFLYFGSASGLATSPSWSAESNSKNATLGFWVSSAGDVNGDGYDDVLASANAYGNSEGAAFLFQGSASGPAATPTWLTTSGQAAGLAGGVSSGDFDGDGYDDVLVGYYNYMNGQISEGAALAYFGSPRGLSTRPGWLVEGNQRDSQFGYALASVGDTNGDGYDDFLVGAYTFDAGQRNEGRAFAYLGFARRRLP